MYSINHQLQIQLIVNAYQYPIHSAASLISNNLPRKPNDKSQCHPLVNRLRIHQLLIV